MQTRECLKRHLAGSRSALPGQGQGTDLTLEEYIRDTKRMGDITTSNGVVATTALLDTTAGALAPVAATRVAPWRTRSRRREVRTGAPKPSPGS